MADSEKYFTKTVDGQLSVATVAQSGEIIPEESRPGEKYTTALVQTDDGPQLCVKTFDLNGGGSGGGDIPDNVYTQDNLVAGTNISITAVPQPVIDVNTLGVWHFDGNTDNAISNSALSWNTSYGGNVVYESGFKKFGSSCSRLSARNTSTQTVFTGDTQSFMTGNWTWDFWIFVNSGATPGSNTIAWSVGYAASNTYPICVSATDVRLKQNGQSVVSDIATSTWHHIAFVKQGTNLYRFFNGKLIDTTEVNPSDMRMFYRYCGNDAAKNNTFFDEMRVSNVARWTEDFTPFSLPYSEDGDPIYQINNTQEGGGGTVDQTYDPTSTNAQSGTAVAEAVAPALKNTATATKALTILGYDSTEESATNIGDQSQAKKNSLAIGKSAKANAQTAVAIGYFSAIYSDLAVAVGPLANVQSNCRSSIQLGQGTNENPNTFQVYSYPLLDGNTGLIPPERLGTGYDATKTQVLKHVNGILTWVDEA